MLSSLVVGTVLVESVFAWPGLGSTIVSSIQLKDYPLVQGTVLVYGVGVLVVNTIVDLVLADARPPDDCRGALMNTLTRILRTPLGIAAVVMLTLVVATAIFAPILWGEEAAAVDTDNMLAGPSLEHPIGTDQLGRDLLLRVLVATRLSVTLAVLATLVAVSAGLILGVAPLLLGRCLGRRRHLARRRRGRLPRPAARPARSP